MKSTFRWAPIVAIGLIAGLLVAPQVLAQNPTGTLIGKVLDVQGSYLPGVTVTATSPNLQGARTAITGVNGDYKFAFLPAGLYEVSYELEGFPSVIREVRMSAAQTQISDVQMQDPTVVEETIVVTSALETISETNTASSTYSQDEVEKLPVQRTPTEATLLTPGVASTGPRRAGNTRGNVTIAGAMSFENLWLVNGVVVNENLRGQSLPLYIEDAIQETTTSVSGVSAEYGRFTGGVINALTKSGGNQFSGSIRANLTNDKWESKTPLSGDRIDELNKTWEATLGGFFWKDHLWFFAAGRDLNTSNTDQTFLTTETFPTTNEQQRIEGKLTVSFTPNHNVIASYLKIDQQSTNDQFSGNIDVNGLTDREDPQEILAFNYTGILTPAFFLEAQYSEREYQIANGAGAKSRTLTEGTLMRWRGTGYRYYTPTFCGVCENEDRNNENALIKASYFLTTEGSGTHDFVVGYDSFEDIRFAINHQTGSDFTVWSSDTIALSANEIYPQFTGTSTWIGWWAVFNPEIATPTSFKTNSFYVNDSWQLNENWAFNIGLRYDQNDGANSSGASVVDDSKVSPRIGLSWDIKGDGDMIVNASYGTYVAAVANSVADSTTTGGAIGLYLSSYGGPLVNTDAGCAAAGTCTGTQDALGTLFDWYLANGGTTDVNGDLSNIPGLFYTSIPGETSIIPDTLRSPAADEFSVGFNKRLGSKGSFRADFVYRVWDDFYSNRTTPDYQSVDTSAGPVDIQWVGNYGNNVLERSYWGLHTQARYRFTDRLTLAGVYTFSNLSGNIVGENSTSGPLTPSPNNWPEYKEVRWNQSKGDLPSDQRHRLRAWLVYDILDSQHHSLSVSWMENFWSGTPYGANGSVDSRPYVNNPGYVTPPATVGYWYQGRDTYTTDNVHRTDLSLNYAFRWEVWNTPMEVFIQPEVLNLFNESAVTQVNTNVFDATTGSNCGSGPCLPFNPFTDTPVEGVHWVKGDDFGQPTAEWNYQRPRVYRFSLGFRF